MQITGKITIRWDGNILAMENNATITPGGYNRNPERHGGKTYYAEEEVAPLLEGNVLITKDTDVIALSDITGATIHCESDNGHQYVIRDAFTTEPVPHSGDGKAPLKMSGQALERIN